MGKAFSMVSMGVATGLVYALGNEGLSYFARLQFNVGLQGFPCLMIGLFLRDAPHPWALASGAAAGVAAVCGVEFAYNEGAQPSETVHSGWVGVAANLLVAAACDSTRRALRARRRARTAESPITSAFVEQLGGPFQLPAWDVPSTRRFGEEPLTAALLLGWR